MAIFNPKFKNLLCSPRYHEDLIRVVVDEAHCIVQWGGDFQPTYGKLDKIHSFVPTDKPFYITSATMMSDVVSEVYRLLHINSTQTFYLNLGNDRLNICQEVWLIRNRHNYAAIDFLFASVTKLEDMECTLIFVNWVEDSQLGWQHSCRLLPAHLQSYVGFLHSR